jgi:hypothetical protein
LVTSKSLVFDSKVSRIEPPTYPTNSLTQP